MLTASREVEADLEKSDAHEYAPPTAASKAEEAHQSTDVGVLGCKKESERTADGWQHEEHAYDRSGVGREASVEPGACEDPDDDKGALRDAEERGLETIEAEALNDERGEVGDLKEREGEISRRRPGTLRDGTHAAVRDIGHQAEREEEPLKRETGRLSDLKSRTGRSRRRGQADAPS